LFDATEFSEEERTSVYSDVLGGECNTTKDQYENNRHTGGALLAVSFCGVIYQFRELYRSEGKQQVALFLFGETTTLYLLKKQTLTCILLNTAQISSILTLIWGS